MTGKFGVIGAPGGPGAAYVYRREEGDWKPWSRLLPRDGTVTAEFGFAVTALGYDVFVSDHQGSGRVYQFDARTGEQIDILTSDNGEFGRVLASESNMLAIASLGFVHLYTRQDTAWGLTARLPLGSASPQALAYAPGAEWLAVSTELGSVRLYQRDRAGQWTSFTELPRPSDEAAKFGASLSFSSTNRLLIGAPETTWEGKRTGVVHLYERENDVWTLRRTIVPKEGSHAGTFGSTIATQDDVAWISGAHDHTDRPGGGAVFPVITPRFEDQRFKTMADYSSLGSQVDIEGDLAVEATTCDDQRLDDGDMKIFRRSQGGTWIEETWDDSDVKSGFATAAVGTDQIVVDRGYSYVIYQQSESVWRPIDLLEQHGPSRLSVANDHVLCVSSGGIAVIAEINSEGFANVRQVTDTGRKDFIRGASLSRNRALIPGRPDDVIVLERSGSNWIEQMRIAPPDNAPVESYFGRSTDLDEQHGIIGAPTHDGAGRGKGTGAAYLYDLESLGKAPLLLPCPETGEMTSFGWAVAIRGEVALVSNPHVQRGLAPGRVYVYHRNPDTDAWHYGETLQASNAEPGDEFGTSIAFDDGWAIIGAKSSWVYFFEIR